MIFRRMIYGMKKLWVNFKFDKIQISQRKYLEIYPKKSQNVIIFEEDGRTATDERNSLKQNFCFD